MKSFRSKLRKVKPVYSAYRMLRLYYMRQVKDWLELGYYKLFKSWSTFSFQHRNYKYFYEKYNQTWRNERTVEIPIVWHILKSSKGDIVELGNVLSHYFNINHEVVDKYEKAEGVLNVDVIELAGSKKYDLIISISTLEHVGYDECSSYRLHDGSKLLLAMDVLKRLLKPNGKLVVTFPLGYNPYLDEFVRSNRLGLSERFCLKRVSKDNRWVEADWEEVKYAKYGSPHPYANGLVIGIFEG